MKRATRPIDIIANDTPHPSQFVKENRPQPLTPQKVWGRILLVLFMFGLLVVLPLNVIAANWRP